MTSAPPRAVVAARDDYRRVARWVSNVPLPEPHLAGVVATLPAAAALVHRQVRREEQRLGADFGGEFERCQAAIPPLPGPRSCHRQG